MRGTASTHIDSGSPLGVKTAAATTIVITA